MEAEEVGQPSQATGSFQEPECGAVGVEQIAVRTVDIAHFDKEKRLCTIYETRPQMCRNHGVEYSCVTQGCTMSNAMRDPPQNLDPKKYPEPSDASLE